MFYVLFLCLGYSSQILSQIRHVLKTINNTTVQLQCFSKRTGSISSHRFTACFETWTLNLEMEEWFISLKRDIRKVGVDSFMCVLLYKLY